MTGVEADQADQQGRQQGRDDRPVHGMAPGAAADGLQEEPQADAAQDAMGNRPAKVADPPRDHVGADDAQRHAGQHAGQQGVAEELCVGVPQGLDKFKHGYAPQCGVSGGRAGLRRRKRAAGPARNRTAPATQSRGFRPS